MHDYLECYLCFLSDTLGFMTRDPSFYLHSSSFSVEVVLCCCRVHSSCTKHFWASSKLDLATLLYCCFPPMGEHFFVLFGIHLPNNCYLSPPWVLVLCMLICFSELLHIHFIFNVLKLKCTNV